MYEKMHFLRRFPMRYLFFSVSFCMFSCELWSEFMRIMDQKQLRRVCGKLRRVEQTLRERNTLCFNNLHDACGEVESCTHFLLTFCISQSCRPAS